MPFSRTMRALLASAAVAGIAVAAPLDRVQRGTAEAPFECGWEGRLGGGRAYIYTSDAAAVAQFGGSGAWKHDTCGGGGDYKSALAPGSGDIAALEKQYGLKDLICIPGCNGCVLGSMAASCAHNKAVLNAQFAPTTTTTTTTPATPVFEFAGPAARLQGAAAVAEQSRPDLQLAQDFTASIWVMPTRRVNDWARVFGKGSRHNRNFGLWIHPDGRVLSQVYGPSSPNVWNVKGATAPLDTWTHIAATFSKDKLHTLYINGAKVGSLATKGTPRTDNEPVTIGKAAFHTGFEGSLARASLMGVAMTADEVKAQYEAAKGGMVVPDVVCAASQYREGSAPGKCVDLTGPRYLGCYTDDGHRDLQDGPRRYGFKPDTCAAACKAYKYFALQNGGWCVCGNAYATEAKYTKRPDTECNKGFVRGGGAWRNAVFANSPSTATDTSGAVDFEFGATVTTTNAAGSILGKAFPTGLWKNGGAAGQGKMLFLRGGKACFDIGWVGVVCGKTNVADGKPHSVAAKFRYGQYHVVVDGKVEGSGLRAIKDHPQTTWVHGKQIGHAGRPGDMAPDFVGTITGAAYAKLPVCEDKHADCPSLKAMCGHAWLGKEVSAGCPLTCRACPM